MAPAVECRKCKRRVSSDRSSSPNSDRHSPLRRTSFRRERSPAPQKSSPELGHWLRINWAQSPVKANVSDRARSAKHMRQLKASASRSLSAQTNRSKWAQAERSLDREHGGKLGREDHDKGRHKRHMEVKDFSRDRKSLREKNDGVSLKSSRRDHSNSPKGWILRSRYSSQPLTRASKVGHGVTCLVISAPCSLFLLAISYVFTLLSHYMH